MTTKSTITVLLAILCHVGLGLSQNASVTITKSGNAVTSWYGYNGYNLEKSEFFPGGILLGNGLVSSQPNYSFYLPPASITSGTKELTQIKVTIHGKGGALGAGTYQIGTDPTVCTLAIPLQANTRVFEGSVARALLVSEGIGQPSRLDVKLDVSQSWEQYDVEYVKVEYTYTGVNIDLLHKYQFILDTEKKLQAFKFNKNKWWGLTSTLDKAAEGYRATVMAALIDSVESVYSAPIGVWYDLIMLPREMNGICDSYLMNINSPLVAFQLWALYPPAAGFDTQLNNAILELDNLRGQWQTAMTGVSVEEAIAALGTQVALTTNCLQSLRFAMNASATHLVGIMQNQSIDSDIKKLARTTLGALSPWMEYDANSGAPLTCSLLYEIEFATANILPYAKLTVNSLNPPSGVQVTVTPTDLSGLGNGTTTFSRIYNKNSQVSLVAPVTANGNSFTKWQRNGVDWNYSRNTQVTMNSSHTMSACYATPPDPGAPVVNILSPTSGTSWTTADNRVYLSGTAAGNVASVTWRNERNGTTGICTNLAYWETWRISLEVGENLIVVTAADTGGRTGSDSIVVTFNNLARDVTFNATESAYVESGDPNDTVDYGSYIYVGYSPISNEKIFRSFIKFGEFSIPPGSTILSASLSLNLLSYHPTNALDCLVTVSPITEDWDPAEIDWYAQPASTSSGASTISVGKVTQATDTYAYTWDVTSAAASWASGTPHYGLALRSSAEGPTENDRGFSSSRHTREPHLKVRYLPESQSPSLAVSFPATNPVVVSGSPISFQGTSSDNYSVRSVTWANNLSGQSGTASGTLAWSADIPLIVGTNTIAFTATDSADNVAKVTRTVIYIAPDTTPPSTPTNLTGSPASPFIASLTWSPSSDTGGAGLKDYVVYRSNLQIGVTVVPEFTDTEFTPNLSHCYAVCARDNSNNVSSSSAPVCLILVTNLAPQLFVQPQSCTNETGDLVILSVSPGGYPPFSYQWFKDGLELNDGGRVFGSRTSTLMINELTETDAGNYSAMVSNTYGSLASSTGKVVVIDRPDIMLTASSEKVSGIQLNWSVISGSGNYKIRRGPSPEALTNYVEEVAGTTFLDTQVVPGTATYYQVTSLTGELSQVVAGLCPILKAIEITGDFIFGDIPIGTSTNRLITISNKGNSVLTVSGIECPAGFFANWSGAIMPGAPITLGLSFSPVAIKIYDGILTVISDATSGVAMENVSGMGVIPRPLVRTLPGAGSAPFSFEIDAIPGLTYLIEESVDLKTWMVIHTTTAKSSLLQFSDPWSVTSEPQKFYRVRAEQSPNDDTGLIGYWKLDGNVLDSSAFANHGISYGSFSYSSNAISAFAGAFVPKNTSWVEIPHQPQYLCTNAMSVAFWLKPDITYSEGRIIQKHYPTDDSPGSWEISYAGSNKVVFYYTWGQASGVCPIEVKAGEWQHLAYTYSLASNMFIAYRNGVEVTNHTPAHTVLPFSKTQSILLMHDRHSYRVDAGGWLDDVRLYNRAITPSEVSQLHLSGVNAGLVGYWKLDGNAFDSGPYKNNGTSFNNLVYSTNAISDLCGEFIPRHSSYVEIPHRPEYVCTNAFTVAFWYKPDVAQSEGRIIQKHYPASHWFGNTWEISFVGSNKVFFVYAWEGSSENFESVCPVDVIPGKWHHIAYTYSKDSNTLSAYRDGEMVTNQMAAHALMPLDTTLSLLLMHDRESSHVDASGWLDEVRFYTRNLSASEIRQLYRLSN